MCAPSSRCPITQVMKENKPLVCPMCNAPGKPTEPVGPPTADRRVAHLRCWIRNRQGVARAISGPTQGTEVMFDT